MSLDPKTELIQITDELHYPQTQAEIIDAVRQAGRGTAVVDLAERLPAGTYESAAAVHAALAPDES